MLCTVGLLAGYVFAWLFFSPRCQSSAPKNSVLQSSPKINNLRDYSFLARSIFKSYLLKLLFTPWETPHSMLLSFCLIENLLLFLLAASFFYWKSPKLNFMSFIALLRWKRKAEVENLPLYTLTVHVDAQALILPNVYLQNMSPHS